MRIEDYNDIINLSPPEPPNHPRMPLCNRAAEFAPFAALTGFGAVISESARLTDARTELSDEQIFELNESIGILCERIKEKPFAEITYFVPDKRKAGGAYVTVAARVRRIDETARELELVDKSKINLDSILKIEIQKNNSEKIRSGKER